MVSNNFEAQWIEFEWRDLVVALRTSLEGPVKAG